eukprot:scaffold100013_cov59-Phaeocystis_antarctica.AAC.3
MHARYQMRFPDLKPGRHTLDPHRAAPQKPARAAAARAARAARVAATAAGTAPQKIWSHSCRPPKQSSAQSRAPPTPPLPSRFCTSLQS